MTVRVRGLEMEPSRARALRIMRSDLQRLQDLEEAYFRNPGEYSGSPMAMAFQASEGVTVSIIASPNGWSGAATHGGYGGNVGCAVYVGSAGPPRLPLSPEEPGVVSCTEG